MLVPWPVVTHVQWLSIILSVGHKPCITAEPIQVLLEIWTCGNPRSHVLGRFRTGKGTFGAHTQYLGGSVAEWLVCWTQAQKVPGSNRSHDAVR